MNNRQSWDHYFLALAKLASSRSKDPSTQTGAVIVRSDHTLCSEGYNGFPKNMPDKPEWYADRNEKYSRVIHCEMNALLSSRERVDGYTLYTYPFASCDRCAVHMLQAGITKFVYPSLPSDKIERWGDSLAKTEKYFMEAGVEFKEIDYV